MAKVDDVVFVGGPASGERRGIPRGMNFYDIHRPSDVGDLDLTKTVDPHATAAHDVVTYQRRSVWMQDEDEVVFLSPVDRSDLQTFEFLLESLVNTRGQSNGK